MPTKPKPKLLDSTVVRFYMAEDFREEKDGKVSAISLFTEPRVLMQIPSTHPDPTPESPAALHSMCFLFNVSKAPAGALVSIDLESPNGKQTVLTSKSMPEIPVVGGSANFILRMTPCFVHALGERTFIVTVNQREFRFNFLIERHSASFLKSGNLPPIQKSSKSRAKTTMK
jgi:hypothetical protein